MKQLAGSLLSVATMLSLMAFCLTVLLLPSTMTIRRPARTLGLQFGNWVHHVYAERGLVHVDSRPTDTPRGPSFYTLVRTDQWHSLGFWFTVEHYPGWHTVTVGVPLWFLLLSTGVLPGRVLIRRRHVSRPGYCATCGYDLRATPNRCPECGAERRTSN